MSFLMVNISIVGETRTHTSISEHKILSLTWLPITTLRQIW